MKFAVNFDVKLGMDFGMLSVICNLCVVATPDINLFGNDFYLLLLIIIPVLSTRFLIRGGNDVSNNQHHTVKSLFLVFFVSFDIF